MHVFFWGGECRHFPHFMRVCTVCETAVSRRFSPILFIFSLLGSINIMAPTRFRGIVRRKGKGFPLLKGFKRNGKKECPNIDNLS